MGDYQDNGFTSGGKTFQFPETEAFTTNSTQNATVKIKRNSVSYKTKYRIMKMERNAWRVMALIAIAGLILIAILQ